MEWRKGYDAILELLLNPAQGIYTHEHNYLPNDLAAFAKGRELFGKSFGSQA